jgi:hypothetical protein
LLILRHSICSILIEIYKKVKQLLGEVKEKHRIADCFYGGLGMLTVIEQDNIAGCLLGKISEVALQVLNMSYAD